jgi:hypothetical protein
MAQKRTAKKKNGQDKDVLVAPDESRALHWKDALVRERETDEEDEIFPGSGLTWDLVAAASGANEDQRRRSTRTLRRIAAERSAYEGSSSAVLDDIPEDPDGEDLGEEGAFGGVGDTGDSSEGELDPNVRYEDDDEDD